MGPSPNALPNRIDRGEPVDVVFMVGDALGDLVSKGKVVAASRVDIANWKIAMAVRAGEPKPDIATVEGLKRAMLEARSIAYSESASGVHIEKTLIPRLGIWEQVKAKSRMVMDEPVAKAIARGDAQIGFQQVERAEARRGNRDRGDAAGRCAEGDRIFRRHCDKRGATRGGKCADRVPSFGARACDARQRRARTDRSIELRSPIRRERGCKRRRRPWTLCL